MGVRQGLVCRCRLASSLGLDASDARPCIVPPPSLPLASTGARSASVLLCSQHVFLHVAAHSLVWLAMIP